MLHEAFRFVEIYFMNLCKITNRQGLFLCGILIVKEGDILVSKAQSKASNKYRAKAYDMIQIATPKGTRDRWRSLAEAEGKSLTAYIVSRVEGAPVSPEAPETAPGNADGSESGL